YLVWSYRSALERELSSRSDHFARTSRLRAVRQTRLPAEASPLHGRSARRSRLRRGGRPPAPAAPGRLSRLSGNSKFRAPNSKQIPKPKAAMTETCSACFPFRSFEPSKLVLVSDFEIRNSGFSWHLALR